MDFRVPPSNLFNPHCKDIQKRTICSKTKYFFCSIESDKTTSNSAIIYSTIIYATQGLGRKFRAKYRKFHVFLLSESMKKNNPCQRGKIKRRFAALKRHFILTKRRFILPKGRFISVLSLLLNIRELQRKDLLFVVVFSFNFFSHFFGNYIAYGLVFCHTLADIG